MTGTAHGEARVGTIRLRISAGERGLTDVDVLPASAGCIRRSGTGQAAAWLEQALHEISGYPGTALRCPVDLGSLTDFQQRVLTALRRIPAGGTTTYGGLAAMIGKPGAVRAVGSACGRNPVLLWVPCHRVIASDGGLGGFSGGLGVKRALLALEGVQVG